MSAEQSKGSGSGAARFVAPVTPEHLAREVRHEPVLPAGAPRPPGVAAEAGGDERLLAAELDFIARQREGQRPDPAELRGLALSGGGIRSATFCLGVLQALARAGKLERFDYLSTVSGGGYIGSALTWWLSGCAGEDEAVRGTDAFHFPYGTDDPGAEPARHTDSARQRALLRHLRQHGNYLTPGAGLGWATGIAVVLRAFVMNGAVWLLFAAVLMLALLGLSDGVGMSLAGAPPAFWYGPPWSWLERVYLALGVARPAPLLFELLLVLSVVMVALFVVLSLLYSVFTWVPAASRARYHMRRWAERLWGRYLKLFAGAVVLGSLPLVARGLEGWVTWLSSGGVGASLISALWTYWRSRRDTSRGLIPVGVIAAAGAGLLVYALLLLGFVLAEGAYGEPVPMAVLVVAAVGLGWVVNLNYVTLHRFYRDRLMETFLPGLDQALANRTSAAARANGTDLADAGQAAAQRGPYHLINANVILVDSPQRRWRLRGGAGFVLSPLYCGSDATGWVRTDAFADRRLSLATAMAISGAAANPNTGVGGVGVTRNRMVSLLMAFFGLSLGYWVRNPRDQEAPRRRFYHALPGSYGAQAAVGRKRFRANHFVPGLYALRQSGFREDRAFVQLSDGGHFDNTGLYELIRRRMKVIVACDAAADRDYRFADLQAVSRRVREDFGAHVTFPAGEGPAVLIPRDPAGFPDGSRIAGRGFTRGEITYADGAKGTLILLKTTMVPGLPLEVQGYKGANPDFPDQTTADQFFDEAQFEAYRALGYRIADAMLGEHGAML